MSYDFSQSGLKMPDKIEPCYRCDTGKSQDFEVVLMDDIRTGYRTPKEGVEKRHVRMCAHCGYMVPVSDGFSTAVEAAVRWNGDQVVQRRREIAEAAKLRYGAQTPPSS